MNSENKLAQPVPSAGSKPQEEGECEWNGRILSKFHEFVNIHGGGRRCIKCKKEFTASIEESQPVADGGGLPPLPKERYWFSDVEVLSHLETSEYQETQIRERLMRMTTGEKYALYRAVIDTAKRKGLVSLLSPEGSSR